MYIVTGRLVSYILCHRYFLCNFATWNITSQLLLTDIFIVFAAIIFHKIVFDPRLEAFMMNTLKEWKHRNPDHLKRDLKKFMKNGTKSAFGKFAETINFIFKKKDGKKLRKILKRYYRGTNKNNDVSLTKMISDSLKYLLVHKYKTLNFLDRTVLSSAITYLADYLSTFYHTKIIHENVTLSLRKEINDTIIKSDELYSNNNALNTHRRSDFITLDMPVLAAKNSLETMLKDSSVEAPKEKEHASKLPINGVIQFNQDINIKVKNVLRNKTTTTTSTTDFYDYKYGSTLTNYTILSVNHTARRRYLGEGKEKRRYLRRNFVHDGHNDEFLQAIEDNVKSKTADYEFTGSSGDSHERRYNIPHREKDEYYNMHFDKKDLIIDRKIFDSQEYFFNGPEALGPEQSRRMPSFYRNFRKMA